MSDYIELRGCKNERVAYGYGGSFLVREITKDSPVILSGSNETMESGCLVYMPAYPPMVIKDFYPVVIEKISQVGHMVDRVREAMEQIHKDEQDVS